MTEARHAQTDRDARLIRRRRVVIALGLLLLLGATFWAGRVTLQPQGASTASPSDILVAVTEQTVGKSYTFAVTVSRPRTPLAVNQLSGVVTSVTRSGRFEAGHVAYSVNNVPVRVVEGSHPFYRSLRRGLSGSDVRQLNDFLAAYGLRNGSGSSFDAGTERAVRRWQDRLGEPQTGEVRLGELVAVPDLPATIVVDDRVARPGAVLTPGGQVLFGSTDEPTFALRLAADQARIVPPTSRLVVHQGDRRWEAAITATSSDPDTNTTTFQLGAVGGGVVCGRDCGSLAVEGETSLLADVTVVPSRTGPAVPVSAIITGADGQTWVTVQEGVQRNRRGVTVVASQDGVAIVSGVEIGEQVQAVADPDSSAPAGLPPSGAESRSASTAPVSPSGEPTAR